MAGEDGGSHRPDAAVVEIDEPNAVACRERTDRRLIDAETAVRSSSVGPPDKAALRIAPPEHDASWNRNGIERPALRQLRLQCQLPDRVTRGSKDHRQRSGLAIVVKNLPHRRHRYRTRNGDNSKIEPSPTFIERSPNCFTSALPGNVDHDARSPPPNTQSCR
jgi:hypothetical protein